jgi:nitrate/nitrite-specific signal transduction histidine kinase
MPTMTQSTSLNLELIAEMVLTLDQLTRDIPVLLGKLRSSEATALARGMALRAQAMRLAISMEAGPAELRADAAELEKDFRRLNRLSLGSRLAATGKAGLLLGTDLASRLSAELLE